MSKKLILFCLVGAGCKPPPQAPSDLEDLCQFIFSHQQDEDTTELKLGLANLDTWIQTGSNLESTIEGYQINKLENESVANLDEGTGICSDPSELTQSACEKAGTCSQPTFSSQAECEASGSCSDATIYDQTECEGAGSTWTSEGWTNAGNTWISNGQQRTIRDTLVGAAVAYQHTHSMDQLVKGVFVDDWSKVDEGTYVCYERVYDDGVNSSCLIDGSCDQVSYQTTSVSNWAGLVTVTSTNTGQIRKVDTEAGPVFLQRTWLNDPAETSGVWGDLVNVYAQYYINITATTNVGIIRTTATWIDGEYFIEDQDFAKSQIVKTMQNQNQTIIDWIDGEQDSEGSCLCSEYDYENEECPD